MRCERQERSVKLLFHFTLYQSSFCCSLQAFVHTNKNIHSFSHSLFLNSNYHVSILVSFIYDHERLFSRVSWSVDCRFTHFHQRLIWFGFDQQRSQWFDRCIFSEPSSVWTLIKPQRFIRFKRKMTILFNSSCFFSFFHQPLLKPTLLFHRSRPFCHLTPTLSPRVL